MQRGSPESPERCGFIHSWIRGGFGVNMVSQDYGGYECLGIRKLLERAGLWV